MKTALALTILITSLSVFSQEAAETTKEINAQTTVTRGHIDNVIQKINNRKTDSRFKARDYWAQNKDFKNSVDAALKSFEDKMEKEIFAKAGYWMDQYNMIYLSQEFSPTQKQILLKQRKENIVNQFEVLSKEYQKALNEVYALVPSSRLRLSIEPEDENPILDISKANFDQEVQFRVNTDMGKSIKGALQITFTGCKNCYRTLYLNYPSKQLKVSSDQYYSRRPSYGDETLPFDVEKAFKQAKVKKDRSAVELVIENLVLVSFFPELEKKIYQTVVYPTMAGSCKSSICLGLRASDQASLLTLINTHLDRNISLTLSDGSRVMLVSTNKDIEMILSYLARVDYPVELPFDI